MKYRVEYTAKAEKTLARMDKQTSARIYAWIGKNLVDCEEPRMFGKALTGNLAGLWRYRVGDYRIIARIKDREVIISVIDIGHRSNVYM